MTEPNFPDFGTPELQRRGIQKNTRNSEGQQVAQRVGQRRIDTLMKRGNITEIQYIAANCFLSDAFFAGLDPSIKSNINFEVVGNYFIGDRIDARNRFYEAAEILTKRELSIVQMIVLGDHFIIEIANQRKEQDEYSDMFKEGLDKLAVFYGITTMRK